jgi:hypothetical protein
VVRRLPVVQSKAPEDAAAEARPRWHWVLIGAGLVITIWIPLVLVALWLDGAVGVVLSLAGACTAGGALIGRFGGRATLREATLSGVVATLGAWAVALVSGALAPWTVALGSAAVLLILASTFAWVGGRIGLSRRPR